MDLKRSFELGRSVARYASFKWLLPVVGHQQHANMNLAERAWPKVSSLSAMQGEGQITSVACEPGRDTDGIAQLLTENAEKSRPIILRNYVDADSWSLDRVDKVVGELPARIRVNYHKQPADTAWELPSYASVRSDLSEVVRMKVSEFTKYLRDPAEFSDDPRFANTDGKHGPYLANVEWPSLAEKMPRSPFFTNPLSTTFWMGADAGTPLHCHQFCDVLLTQLIGRRTVALVGPHKASMVGCIPRTINICTAALDPFEPDEEAFPCGDVSVRADLDAGDALLIPGFWFHAVSLYGGPSFSGSQFNDARMPLAIGGGTRAAWRHRPFLRGWG